MGHDRNHASYCLYPKEPCDCGVSNEYRVTDDESGESPMQPEKIKQWLTGEEWKDFKVFGRIYRRNEVELAVRESARRKIMVYESLAACREEIANLKSDLEDYKYFVKQRNERIAATRELLKGVKQYVQDEFRGIAFDEEQEREWKDRGQKIITAIATALKGVGGEEK